MREKGERVNYLKGDDWEKLQGGRDFREGGL